MVNTIPAARLDALMAAINQAGLDLYLVPMVDAFQSEYIPAGAARLPYITGFTGSAGLGVFWAKPGVGRRHSLFVDGRYTIQAANEVDTARLAVINSGDVPLRTWFGQYADDKLRVGFDPWLVTQEQLTQWSELPVEWVPCLPNLVDSTWSDRPALPSGDVVIHPIQYAGASYNDKRHLLLESMRGHRAQALVLAQPDSINWLLNIRGADIPFNPLLLAYFVLQADGKSTLYTYGHNFSSEVQEYLAAAGVAFVNVSQVFDGTAAIAPTGSRVMIDPTTTAHGWFQLAEKQGLTIVPIADPTLILKAQKNPVELAGIREAHKRDGLALSRFLHWFDQRTAGNDLPMELEVVDELEKCRARDANYRGPSFATIAGSGPHGAIVHYRVSEATDRRARNGELFLLDSGGQYPDGTTDVTRTIAVGIPSAAMKEHFTRVLKGHIALASAIFPAGTSGIQLDALARQFLWAAGLDYDHGTGHGVGAYLCVHEGPQRISKRGSSTPLAPGMVISNEPGYYAADQYGIRIESLVTVVERGHTVDNKPQLGFETLTLAPIDTRLVDIKLLTAEERNWLNAYHQRVYKTHAEHLDEPARAWLLNATRAI